MNTRLCDPATWLLLAAGASSSNLVFTFLLCTVLSPAKCSPRDAPHSNLEILKVMKVKMRIPSHNKWEMITHATDGLHCASKQPSPLLKLRAGGSHSNKGLLLVLIHPARRQTEISPSPALCAHDVYMSFDPELAQ